jgi:hypothetical protein
MEAEVPPLRHTKIDEGEALNQLGRENKRMLIATLPDKYDQRI